MQRWLKKTAKLMDRSAGWIFVSKYPRWGNWQTQSLIKAQAAYCLKIGRLLHTQAIHQRKCARFCGIFVAVDTGCGRVILAW
jgi:hypothetical protein